MVKHGNQHSNGYTDDELLAEIERVAREVGENPTAHQFNENSDIAHTTILRRFDTWNKAKELAGFDEPVRKYRQGDKSKKNWIENYKSDSSCMLCDEDFNGCLSFHHKPDEEKIAMVSTMKTTPYSEHNLHDVKKEVEKCVVLCANCHRKVHADNHTFSL